MIRLSVMYPNKDGATFDHDYYKQKHFAIVREAFGPAVKRVEVDRCLPGADGSPPQYVAACHIYFDSPEAMQGALGNAAAPMADIPNFTNTQPQMLVSETAEI